MTREEAINDLKDFIDTYITVHGEEDTIAVSIDNVDVEAFHMAIEALEKENSNKQRYVVKGINNDKIEFVDKYSVRAFNRYVEFITHDTNKVLDKIRAEIEETYTNITYQENRDRKATWGLRKALEIIDKCRK